MNEPNLGKRIVSGEEYARIQGKCTLLRIGAVLLYVLAAVLFLTAGETLFSLLIAMGKGTVDPLGLGWILLWFLLTASIGIVCKETANKLTKRAAELGKVTIATRSNTARLPAKEILVRASTQPAEQQQAVLLRAASPCDTTPTEQLVRPAGGNGDPSAHNV